MLLQVLYSIRLARQWLEQAPYDLLYRRLIGLSMNDTVWVLAVFTKYRQQWLSKEHLRQPVALHGTHPMENRNGPMRQSG